MPARAAAWLILASLIPAVGCEGIAYVTQGFAGGNRVQAEFELPDRKTLVLVDDPEMRLGDPVLVNVIAANVQHQLEQNKAINAPFVDTRALTSLASRLGDEFATTPIDEVGRRLDAEQVIYVRVNHATLRIAASVYRPTCVVDVKVIDATDGSRMFPPANVATDPRAPTPGRTVTVEMTPRDMDSSTRGMDAIVGRRLAEQTGLHVARLFFNWKKPEMGSTYDDPYAR